MTLEQAKTTPLGAAFFASDRADRPAAMLPSPTASEQGLEPGSSQWWIARLMGRLRHRNSAVAVWRSYFEGTWDTSRLTNQAFRDTFGSDHMRLRANLSKTVVTSVEHRLNVLGFSSLDDPAVADMAWEYWRANELDDESSSAHLDMLVTGACPIFVDAPTHAGGAPFIHRELAENVMVEPPVSLRPNQRGLGSPAAIHTWIEDDTHRYVVLMTPQRIEWYRSEQQESLHGQSEMVYRPYEGDPSVTSDRGGYQIDNPLGEIPIVMLKNTPRRTSDGLGVAEHAGIEGLIDGYTKTMQDIAVVSDHAGYPQRYATGISLDDEAVEMSDSGEPAEAAASALIGGANRLIGFENPETTVGQFAAAELGGFISVLNQYRADIAADTSTPPRLLVPPPTSVGYSGEAMRVSDYELTAKVLRKQASAGNAWVRVMRLAFRTARLSSWGNPEGPDLSTVWREPTLQTLNAELLDALVKMQALGIGQPEIMRRLGIDPQTIRQAEEVPSPVPSDPPIDDIEDDV